MSKRVAAVVSAALVAGLASACGGGGSSSSSDTIKVAYQKFGSLRADGRAHEEGESPVRGGQPGRQGQAGPDPGRRERLLHQAQPDEPLRHPPHRTCMYEDTFLVNSDVSAGYLAPIDDYARASGRTGASSATAPSGRQGRRRQDLRRPDGHRHPRPLVQQADLRQGRACRPTGSPRPGTTSSPRPGPSRARCPGSSRSTSTPARAPVRPPPCRASRCCSTARKNTLYDDASKKWVARRQGFTDSLDFLKTVYSRGARPDPAGRADPQFGTNVAPE